MQVIVTQKTHFFDNYAERVSAGINRAIERGTLNIEASAKQNCPVRTGNLRASIHSSFNDIDGGKEGIVGTGVEYAECVEYGTYKMAAQPFLYPALQENIEDIKKEIEDVVGGKDNG